MIKSARDAAIVLALMALLWPILETASVLHELALTVADARIQIRTVAHSLTSDASDLTNAAIVQSSAVVDQISAVRRDLLVTEAFAAQSLADLTNSADANLKETNRQLGATLSAASLAVTEIARIRQDVQPLLADAAHITAQAREDSDLLLDCTGNPQCLPNRIIGTNQAIERSAQEVQRTMRAVADGIPPILATALKVGDNSDATTRSTAQLMNNLAVQTHPLPTWMRVGLQISVPAAGIAAGIATTRQATQ